MSVKIGAHVDLSDAVAQAKEIGADVVQVFVSDPQAWKVPPIEHPGGTEAFREEAAAAGLDVYVHAPYVINVASTNNRIRIPSRKLLQQVMVRAEEIGAKGVIVHGGHVTAKDDPAAGFDNWRKAIDALESDVPVLIENTAGGDFSMARRLERIEQLWAAVMQANGAENVGFTLDTCHAWAGGIDLATAVDEIRGITGRIDLVHANDSRDAAGSGADRHTHFGLGMIPEELLVGVIATAGAPVICETHGDMGPDIAWLRERLA
ncbi:deoxyribonuclease IV [Isoptericola variabilis]|uniref:Deoxyribonuclease IV (Phage-T(4)-induced) n=1 Tax=Isoptericola variabilis (strain 225) TaxID=743718 RepID=F6FW55_ISOV2|nr:deoxyribonuclease IV [Isoptericola variabilis]AEG45599.1 Deoxyribonuclease IV (phage-T(4)-induced) [Isoptericola variabilis 225]TWH25793.1 deoxyribonuclease-4 [Isoptericola variabilis J7]